MATAKQWADFLKKLGVPIKRKSIINYIEGGRYIRGQDEIWDHFIASNRDVLEAAHYNKIFGVDDIDRYYSDISYADMRSTFPSKSHGRRPIVPRLKNIQEIKEEESNKNARCNANYKEFLCSAIQDNLVGRNIVHKVYGPGIITQQKENGSIKVNFDSVGEKYLGYRFCVINQLISFENKNGGSHSVSQ